MCFKGLIGKQSFRFGSLISFTAAVTLTVTTFLCLTGCRPGDGNPSDGTYTITVTVNPAEGGTVTIDPAEGPYTAGQVVTLTAQASAGYEFDRWQGSISSTANPAQVTVDDNLVIEAVFVATGNGGGGGGATDTEINENVRVLPDTVEVTTDDEGHTTLTGQGIPTGIAPGALLVSARGEGRLLRVKSVPTVGDGQVIVETEQASLADLIRKGSLEISVPFDPNTAVLQGFSGVGSGDMKHVRFLRTGDRSAAFTTNSHSIELEDWGKVTLDQLTINVDPDFSFTASIEDNSLKHLRCTAGTGFHLSMDVSIEAYKISELLKKEQTIGKVKWPDPVGVMVIAGVPVVYQVFLEVKVGAQVKFGDMGAITAGLDFDADATLGAEYNKGEGWDLINEKSTAFTPHTPEWGISPITAQVYVQPEFGMTFYGCVGPSLSWKEYVELAGAYRYDVLGAELARGSECDFNLTFKIIDGLPSYKYSHNLFSTRQVLLARMLTAVDPAELGSASLSPGDLVWDLYDFTKSLTATARPNAGYEVAGWTIYNLLSGSGETVHASQLHNQPVNASKLFVAGIVPEGYGDTWTGAGTGSGAPSYALTTEVFPPEAGEIMLFPGGGVYQYGVNVLVAPKPNSGFEFHHWEGALSGNGPTGVISMTSSRTVRAVFASNPPRTLYVPSHYPTLQDALNAATYNDIIHIEAGTHAGTGFHDISIPRDHIVIQGAGPSASIIDLEGVAQLGWLDDIHITFQNLQISRGLGDLGGALRLTGDTTASFKNCTFSSCNASYGGAVYVSGTGAIVSFENCRFESNQATSSGGALSLSNTPNDEEHVPVVAGCTFTGNMADSSGGGIVAGQKCRITGCTFAQNRAWRGGGGSFGKEGVVSGCVFDGNSAQYGGGVSADEYSSFSECSFINNVAEWSGGGVKAGNGVSIQYCTLDNNQAGEDGGAIYADCVSAGKTLFIVGCAVSGNSAGENGGGIWCDGTEVSQTELTGNSAGWRGGGICADHSQISSCFLYQNQAGAAGNPSYSEGGGIYLEQTNVSNCQLIDNEAIDGNGGGIYAQGSFSDTAVPPVIFEVYAAFNTAKNGGGMGSDLEVHIFSSIFEDNEASYRGGGIYAERGPLVSLCRVEHNSSQQGGGAGISEGTILASTITRNQASQWAGGLSLFKSTAQDCTVSHNTAATAGGGIWTGIECSISNCTVAYNALTDTTSTGGGGIACHGAPTLSGVTVYGNTPTNCNSDCPCP
ncbi:MAG TPA: hypothetical protein PLL20_03295 [Phycisphaerae bacterium]|nr:hypothetical protein [Phycisphaerae bacterium]HRR83741.1 hypothetical protein [Phycisphaerae bacterium]